MEISDGGDKKKLLRQARFFDSYDDGDIKIIFAEMTEIISEKRQVYKLGEYTNLWWANVIKK